MTAVLSHQRIFTAPDEGRTLTRPFVKNPSIVTAAGIYVDLTVFGRYPAAQYYTDTSLAARPLRRSTDGGMDHGEDKGPLFKKFLQSVTALTVTAGAIPLPMLVMDYLMFYPLIPMEDVQEMDNTLTLPRYTDGRGVQMMLVEQFPYIGGGTCRITYTNQDGVAGRLSAIMTINTQTALGTIATSAPATVGVAGPFVPLQQGDSGVRSVESIEFFTADAGNIAIVLVKPLAPCALYETTCPGEWDFNFDLGILPVIEDDAFISIICLPAGSLSGAILDGSITTIWSEA